MVGKNRGVGVFQLIPPCCCAGCHHAPIQARSAACGLDCSARDIDGQQARATRSVFQSVPGDPLVRGGEACRTVSYVPWSYSPYAYSPCPYVWWSYMRGTHVAVHM